jgi:hypothetical protein
VVSAGAASVATSSVISGTGVTFGSNEADDTGSLVTGTSAATSSAGVSDVASAVASTGGVSVEMVSTTSTGAGFGGNGGRRSMR